MSDEEGRSYRMVGKVRMAGLLCSGASARPHYVVHLLDAETRSVSSFA